jgi:hypothetical protein
MVVGKLDQALNLIGRKSWKAFAQFVESLPKLVAAYNGLRHDPSSAYYGSA